MVMKSVKTVISWPSGPRSLSRLSRTPPPARLPQTTVQYTDCTGRLPAPGTRSQNRPLTGLEDRTSEWRVPAGRIDWDTSSDTPGMYQTTLETIQTRNGRKSDVRPTPAALPEGTVYPSASTTGRRVLARLTVRETDRIGASTHCAHARDSRMLAPCARPGTLRAVAGVLLGRVQDELPQRVQYSAALASHDKNQDRPTRSSRCCTYVYTLRARRDQRSARTYARIEYISCTPSSVCECDVRASGRVGWDLHGGCEWPERVAREREDVRGGAVTDSAYPSRTTSTGRGSCKV
ncbi:hypothetical protein C8Q80DRAFT_441405 [Daedaleopsis nitida]|nr:hypothetical protein C8Q80DRAFT_441405 [Daedaleopsis nitida]